MNSIDANIPFIPMTYSDAVKIGESQKERNRANIENRIESRSKKEQIKLYNDKWNMNTITRQESIRQQYSESEQLYGKSINFAKSNQTPPETEIPIKNRYTYLIPDNIEERMLYPLIKARKRKREEMGQKAEDHEDKEEKEVGIEQISKKSNPYTKEDNGEEDTTWIENLRADSPYDENIDEITIRNENLSTDRAVDADDEAVFDEDIITDRPSRRHTDETVAHDENLSTDRVIDADDETVFDEDTIMDRPSQCHTGETVARNENLNTDRAIGGNDDGFIYDEDIMTNRAPHGHTNEMTTQEPNEKTDIGDDQDETMPCEDMVTDGPFRNHVNDKEFYQEISTDGNDIEEVRLSENSDTPLEAQGEEQDVQRMATQDETLETNNKANETLTQMPRGRKRIENQVNAALSRLTPTTEDSEKREEVTNEEMRQRWKELIEAPEEPIRLNEREEKKASGIDEIKDRNTGKNTLNIKYEDLTKINKNNPLEESLPRKSEIEYEDIPGSLDHYDEHGNDMRKQEIGTDQDQPRRENAIGTYEGNKDGKDVKIRAICRQCHSTSCETFKQSLTMLSIDKTECNPVKSYKHQSLTPLGKQKSIRNLWETHKWPRRIENTQIREQPFFRAKKSEGARYSAVIVINNTILDAQVDTGSFASCMSRRLAQSLGLPITKSEPIWAKTASGRTQFCHTTHAQTDFGTFSADVTYSIATDESWDILLIGASTLEALKANINFEKSTMKIMGAFNVKLFQGPVESRKYMMTIKATQISLSAIEVYNKKLIRLPPKSRIEANLFVERLQAVALENTYSFFEGRPLTEDVRSTDLLIDAEFAWRTKPLEIGIINDTNEHKIIFPGSLLGTLKPVVSPALAKKLRKYGIQDSIHIPPELPDLEEDIHFMAILKKIDEVEELDNDDLCEVESGEFTCLPVTPTLSPRDSPMGDAINPTEPQEQPIQTSGQSQTPRAGPESELEKEYHRIAKNIEDQAIKQVGGYKVDFTRPNVETQEVLFERYKLPDYLKKQIQVEQESAKDRKSVSRLVIRNDDSVENIDKRIAAGQAEKRSYWENIGREKMMKMITWGKDLTPEQLKRAQDITWEHRDTFGNILKHAGSGCRHFAIKIERNTDFQPPAVLRRASSPFAKALWERYLQAYTAAGLAVRSTNSAYSNSFLVRKPKCSPETPKIDNLADLKNPKVTDEVLNKRFRLVIDLSTQNKFCDPFSAPSPAARDVLAWFARSRKIISLDALNWFSQVKLDPQTRAALTFQGASEYNYEPTGSCMGHSSSMQLCTLLMSLMFCDILNTENGLTYADNLNIKAPTTDQLLSIYEKILERSRMFNLTWKLSDTHIGMSTSGADDELEILGFSVGQDMIKIPERKKQQYTEGIPKTRKEIVRFIGRVNFFQCFSTTFSEILKDVRTELALMKSRKFVMTPKLEAALRCLTSLYLNNPGLFYISSDDYANRPFILFCDASTKSWGAIVLCLFGDQLLPLRATSQQFSKDVKNFCTNRKECYAIYNACIHFSLLLSNRKFFIFTDNSFAVKVFEKPAIAVAPKLRSITLLLRERFQFRIDHVRGNHNELADSLSRRYAIIARGNEAAFSEDDFKWVKRHMQPITVSSVVAEAITKQHEEFVAGKPFNIQDQITAEIQARFPSCYMMNAEADSRPEQGTQENMHPKDKGRGLTTIHKVTSQIKQSLAPSLNEAQKLRLGDADYIIMTEESNEESLNTTQTRDPRIPEREIQNRELSPRELHEQTSFSRRQPIDKTPPEQRINLNDRQNDQFFSSDDSDFEGIALRTEAFASDNSELQRAAMAAELAENQPSPASHGNRRTDDARKPGTGHRETNTGEDEIEDERLRVETGEQAGIPHLYPSDSLVDLNTSLAQSRPNSIGSQEALELINQGEEFMDIGSDEAEQRKLQREREAKLLEYLGEMKFDEESHVIATLQNEDGNLLNKKGEPSIGLNRFIPTEDGGVEIIRNFEYLPVDNLSEIGSSFHVLVKEDENNEISPHGEMETWTLHPTLRDKEKDILDDGTISEQKEEIEAALEESDEGSMDMVPATPGSSDNFSVKQEQHSNDELLQNLSVSESAWGNQETNIENHSATGINTVSTHSKPINSQFENYADSGLRLTQFIPELLIDSDEEISDEEEGASTVPESEIEADSDEEEFDPEWANVMAITRNSAKRRREEVVENLERTGDTRSEDDWKRMKRVQLLDNDIKSFIELVQRGQRPLEYEVRAESPLANNLYLIFDSLLVINGQLYKKTLDENNDVRNLLVVPQDYAPGLIKREHEKLCHMDFWRIEKSISNKYYIYNLKELSKVVKSQCEKCLLSRKPAIPPHRHIKTFSSSPGWAASCDIVHLPQVGPYKYILTCIDLASGYIFARKQTSKGAEETARSFQNIQWANGVTFRVVVVDPGREFINHQFQMVCDSNSTQIVVNHVLNKNACGAIESAHNRLLTLLRRTLESDSDWPKQYKKCTFALNACLFRYGKSPGCITSPLSLFNARSIEVAWAENEIERGLIEKNASVRQLMNKIAKERLIYVPMLSANVLNRKTFHVTQKVLVWREFCLKKRILHTGEVRMKLNRYWSIGEVINAVAQDIYEIRLLKTGETRRVHRRQIRELPVDFDPENIKE